MAPHEGQRHRKKNLAVKFAVTGLESALLFILIWLSSYFYELYIDTEWEMVPKDIVLLITISILSWVFIASVDPLPGLPRIHRYRSIFFRCAKLHSLNLFVLIAFKYVFWLQSVPVLMLVMYSFVVFMVMFWLKAYVYTMFKIIRTKGYDIENILIITDAGYEPLIDELISSRELGLRVMAIQTKSLLIALRYKNTTMIYSHEVSVRQIIEESVIDEIYLFKSAITKEEYSEVVDICNEIGIILRLQTDIPIFENKLGELKPANGTPFVDFVDLGSGRLALLVKRMSDYYISLLALITLLPFLTIIALAIKIDSRGPVIFRQERIGKRGRRFILYKFRTMTVNAEQMRDKLQSLNEADGPVFKIKNDIRITRVGKLLRRVGLDEVPQFINVLRGEMSLIGPRPPLPAEVEKYEPWQVRRLSVKPGITCSWQVAPNRNQIKFEKWMQLDLQYIDNWSLDKDFILMFRTVGTFFRAGGS